jgi:hypothetical protein
MWKDVVIDSFVVLCQYLPGDTEERYWNFSHVVLHVTFRWKYDCKYDVGVLTTTPQFLIRVMRM